MDEKERGGDELVVCGDWGADIIVPVARTEDARQKAATIVAQGVWRGGFQLFPPHRIDYVGIRPAMSFSSPPEWEK